MDKQQLRKSAKEIRGSISLKQKLAYDEAIYKRIIESEAYKASKVIFIFVSFGSEITTHNIINKALDDNKVVCIPKIISKSEGMKACAIESLSELKPNKFGILEPVDTNNEVNSDKIDLAIVPGLFFDLNGGRIGYGAGYYDRFLKFVRKDTKKIGIAYDFQIIDKVPMDENDVYMDFIITN